MVTLAERKALEIFNDLAIKEGIMTEQDETKSLIETLVPYKGDPLKLFQSGEWETVKGEISAMPPTLKAATVDYLCRRLGLKTNLKKAISKELLSDEEPTEELEPWPEKVDGAKLADEIKNTIRRFVILEDTQATAVTVWTFLTYTFDNFRILPLLTITSPTKRCGKTRLLEVLSGIVKNGLISSNLTPSAVFRLIEKEKPTLLMDEQDTYGKSEEFRGIINSGHTRNASFVIRSEKSKGEQFETRRFSTWAPKVIAMIGVPPDTIIDRSIMIPLRRKLSGEKVDRLPLNFFEQQAETRRKLLRWAGDNLDALKASHVEAPSFGNDRAADNWTPLFVIADILGGEWPELVKKAYLAIEAGKEEDEDIRIKLLGDIQSVLAGYSEDAIPSADLVDKLINLEDAPWGEWNRGKPMTPNGLARMLKPFDLKPRQVRIYGKQQRGYVIEDLEKVFTRYIPRLKVSHPSQANKINRLDDFQSVTEESGVTLQNERKYAESLNCDTCDTLKGGNKGKNIKNDDFNLLEGVL